MSTPAPEQPELPAAITAGLNPALQLRPYQADCFAAWLRYWQRYGQDPTALHHLLFHMATGSGKTLIMAGLMLHLYTQGYRNFLFFVNSTNIIEKTRENFLNPSSGKYLFAPVLELGGQRVQVRAVNNFRESQPDCINLCLTTIQKLHSDLNTAREGCAAYDDFAQQSIVFISDEAHHINASTRKNRAPHSLTPQQLELAFEAPDFAPSYENTVLRLFNAETGSALPNVLLDFSATIDFDNRNLAEKYRNKLIFDYSLRRFRQDGYSKNISLQQSTLPPMQRALLAALLSQYKRKLFASIGLECKPVILFKSRLIKENAAFHREFSAALRALTVAELEQLRRAATGDTAAIFELLTATGYSPENLIAELQEDFSAEKLLLVDNTEITPDKQLLLNSLESPSNKIRAIFAVDMLNEGWDVLNLCDIVRLYDTQSTGKPGGKTVAEAQLIGRGARYLPFADRSAPHAPTGRRKYDDDCTNPLRLLETLHYHSATNSRYVQELNSALVHSGLLPQTCTTLTADLKPEFCDSEFYRSGRLYFNRCEQLLTADTAPLAERLREPLCCTLQLRKGRCTLPLVSLGQHLLRAALNRCESYSFDRLRSLFPALGSLREFIESPHYLAGLSVQVEGCTSRTPLTPQQRLRIATVALQQLVPQLPRPGHRSRGRQQLNSAPACEMVLSRTIQRHYEPGQSPADGTVFAMCDWFARSTCAPTPAELPLLQALLSATPQLRERYRSMWLIPNHGDVRLHELATGTAFAPSFILCLVPATPTAKPLQIYIDCRSEHLQQLYRHRAATLTTLQTCAESTFAGSLFTRPTVMGRALYTPQAAEDFVQELMEIDLNHQN
ncbi:MAG: DEAD/DEAH box helicase family protein [Akkermansia sp.]|nr:DEAD/DEAH box helicase family protein [Akkermansia sp.]